MSCTKNRCLCTRETEKEYNYTDLFQVNYLIHPLSNKTIPESAWCAIPFEYKDAKVKIPFIMMIVTTVLFFVLPLVLVTTLYFRYASITLVNTNNAGRSVSDGQRSTFT